MATFEGESSGENDLFDDDFEELVGEIEKDGFFERTSDDVCDNVSNL